MWQREDHKVKPLRAGDVLAVRGIIDITPTPERVNRRVTKMELEAHQARRTVAFDAARERMALEAANEALEPLARTWWARLMRRLRGMVA